MLVALGVLLVAADRGGAAVAERALADQLQRSAGLSSRPEVDVRGVPFLTQALAGRYERVDVLAQDVTAVDAEGRPVVLRRFSATVRGARLPLADAVSGAVASVPVDRVDAGALVPYTVLQRSSEVGDLTVAAEGGRLRLRGTVQVFGREVTGSALSSLELEDGAVVVTAESIDVGNRLANRLLSRALRGGLDLRVPLGTLPYGLEVRGVEVRSDGLSVTARATDTVLSGPPS